MITTFILGAISMGLTIEVAGIAFRAGQQDVIDDLENDVEKLKKRWEKTMKESKND